MLSDLSAGGEVLKMLKPLECDEVVCAVGLLVGDDFGLKREAVEKHGCSLLFSLEDNEWCDAVTLSVDSLGDSYCLSIRRGGGRADFTGI